MIAIKFGGTVALVIFLVFQFTGEIQCKGLIRGVLNTVGGLVKDGVLPIFQTPTTRALSKLQTDQLILHYGYIPERHQVITQDGYNLTIFRCNSIKPFAGIKRVVVLMPGIGASSDDYVMNLPHQALAYVMADAGYDVWMPNHRGSFYSRQNLYMSPDDPSGDFWNFSYEDIGLKDYPPTFAYILGVTKQPKLFVIAHSMGTSAMLALLAVRPEFNEIVLAMSLMAPIGFLKNCKFFYRIASTLEVPLQLVADRELIPRGSYTAILGSVCRGVGVAFCNSLINIFFGESVGQRNNSMLPTYFAHSPAGTSTTAELHYISEVNDGYFGSRYENPYPQKNFPLHLVTAPISLHYSIFDTYADAADVKNLIPFLSNSKLLHVQPITAKFNHLDFVWGIYAAEIVYRDIIKFFANFK